MAVWVVPASLAALVVMLWLLTVQVRVRLAQDDWDVRIALQVRAPLLKFTREFRVSEAIKVALSHMARRWRAKGEPVKAPVQVTVRKVPRQQLLRVLSVPGDFAVSRTKIRTLVITVDVGGGDAMSSALLVGTWWTAIGAGLGYLSMRMRLRPDTPRVAVIPHFDSPTCRVRLECIAQLRLGNAIVAGFWLLARAAGEAEIWAWLRDSWRRKGEEHLERSSNSEPDADRHGIN